jgi:antitoxin HicB
MSVGTQLEGGSGMKKRKKPDSFDDFLKEEGIYETVTAAAIKRVIAFQIEKAMKEHSLTKMAMAKKMATSRAALDRLLNPDDDSITLKTLVKAANVCGKKISLELI